MEAKQKKEEIAKMLRKKPAISSSDEEEAKRYQSRHIISDVDLNEAGDEEQPPGNLVGSVVKGTLAKKERLDFESQSEKMTKKTRKRDNFRPSF